MDRRNGGRITQFPRWTSRLSRTLRACAIGEKLIDSERLDFADGMSLWKTRDIFSLGELADFVRREKHGNVAYYNINRHINYSNICALSCKFCEFHRKRGEPGAYEYLPRRCFADRR